MDCLGAAAKSGLNNIVDNQIGFGGGGWTYMDGFVSEANMQ